MKLIGASVILFGLQMSYCAVKYMGPNGFWKEVLAEYAVQFALPLFICGIGWEVWKFSKNRMVCSATDSQAHPQACSEGQSAVHSEPAQQAVVQPEADSVAAV